VTAEAAPFRLPPTPAKTELLAKYFRVVGDPTRLRILEELERSELTVGELVARLALPQPKVSNHLACLRWCGFVDSRREGRSVRCRAGDPRVAELIELGRALLEENAEHVALCRRADESC
jgi:ArsR family transcriptional regulator, cadmium/lead-responsive transcriptional repressor